MKVKGISIWEQHLEKIIIGLALLVFVGFTAWQFIGEPNAVETAGQQFTPANVDDTLEELALSLEGPLQDDQGPPIDLDDVSPIFSAIESELNDAVVPRHELPRVVANIMPSLEGSVAAGALVNVPQVPTPIELRRDRYFDSVVDEFVSAEPTVQALFEGPPYDIQFTTTAATFEIGKLRDRLLARGPDGEAPVPSEWHNNQVHMIDVRLERQELIDGAWTDPILIDPIPTQASYREELASQAVDRTYADKIIAQLTNNPNIQFAVIQPNFYPLENSRWSPPTIGMVDGEMEVEDDEVLNQIRIKERELNDWRRRAAAVWRQLEQLGGLYEDPEDQGAGRDRSSGGGGGGNAPPGAGGSDLAGGNTLRDPSGASPPSQADLRKQRQLTIGYNRLMARIRQLEVELEALGVQIVHVEEEPEFDPVAELQDDTIDVWAHDLTVESDKTYRYRIRVDVYNPLFGRKLNLKMEQHDVAEQFTLNSDWSEWSQPIEIQRPLEVFVTAANTSSVSGNATAQIEVYRFYDGRWWMEDFNVAPGERIGEIKQVRRVGAQPGDPQLEIDFTTSWFVLDVVPGIGADADDALGRGRGMGAAVYLQSLTSSDDFMVRLPAVDQLNPDRQILEDEAEASDGLVASR